MKLSVQTGGIIERFSIEETYKLIAQAGFEAVDWNIDHAWASRGAEFDEKGDLCGCIFDHQMEEILAFYEPELRAIRENGLVIGQCHAPFPAFKPDQPEFLDYAIGVYKKIIEFCGIAGCPYIVIHGYSRRAGTGLRPADVDRINEKLYTSLIPELQKTPSVVVCMENLQAGSTPEKRISGHCHEVQSAIDCIDGMNRLAGREAFGLCLDTGHLFLMHKDVFQYVPALGKRIKILHVHDNDGFNDQHLAPYAGKIPWEDYLDALHEAGYRGTLNFETFAQMKKSPDALFAPMLSHIANIGKYFISRIEG